MAVGTSGRPVAGLSCASAGAEISRASRGRKTAFMDGPFEWLPETLKSFSIVKSSGELIQISLKKQNQHARMAVNPAPGNLASSIKSRQRHIPDDLFHQRHFSAFFPLLEFRIGPRGARHIDCALGPELTPLLLHPGP